MATHEVCPISFLPVTKRNEKSSAVRPYIGSRPYKLLLPLYLNQLEHDGTGIAQEPLAPYVPSPYQPCRAGRSSWRIEARSSAQPGRARLSWSFPSPSVCADSSRSPGFAMNLAPARPATCTRSRSGPPDRRMTRFCSTPSSWLRISRSVRWPTAFPSDR